MLNANAVGYSLNNSAIKVLLPDLNRRVIDEFGLKFKKKEQSHPLGPDRTTARGFFVASTDDIVVETHFS